MKKLFLFVTLTLFSLVIFATDVSGEQSGVWTLANSPYNIIGNVEVPEGSNLQIEPGVTVLVMGNYRLSAAGTITAVGTPADSIRFESGMTDPDATWKGIRITNTTQASTFTHIYVEKAEMGINCQDSPATISYSRFYENEKGIRLYGMGNPNPPFMEVHNCIIEYSEENGILVHQQSNSHIRDNEICYNGTGTRYYGAIQLSNQSASGSCSPEIYDNHIHHNFKQGITAWDITGSGTAIAPYIHNNVIEYNLTGIYLLHSSGCLKENIIRHNFVSGNTNSGAGVMIGGTNSQPYLLGNEIHGNFCGLYLGENTNPVLGDLASNHIWASGGNQIYENIDESNVPHSIFCFSYTNSSIVIKAENNYWGTADPAQIDIGITDQLDDPSLPLVDYEPFLTSPPQSTGISGTVVSSSGQETLTNGNLMIVGATSGLTLHSFPAEIGVPFEFQFEVDEAYYVVANAEVEGEDRIKWTVAGTLAEPTVFEPDVLHEINELPFHVMRNYWDKYYVGEPIQEGGRNIYPVYHQFLVFHWDYINWFYDEGDYRYLHSHTRYHEDGNIEFTLPANSVYQKLSNLEPNDLWFRYEIMDEQGTMRISSISYLNLEDGIILDKEPQNVFLQMDTTTGRFLSSYRPGGHIFVYNEDGYCNETLHFSYSSPDILLQTGTELICEVEKFYILTPSDLCYDQNRYANTGVIDMYWVPPVDDYEHEWTHYEVYANDVLVASTDDFTPMITLPGPDQDTVYQVVASDGTNQSAWGDGLFVQFVSNDDPIMPPATLSIYPNPFSSGVVNIKLDDPLKQSGCFSVYNLRGQKVYTEKFAKGAGAELFWNGKDQKGSKCASGIYLLKVDLRDGRGFVKRMVKM